MAIRSTVRTVLFVLFFACSTAQVQAKNIADQISPDSTLAVRLQAFKEFTSAVTTKALGALGIKYTYGGDNPLSGMDCSGFVKYVFEQAWGKELPRTAKEQSIVGEKIDKSELQPGDLVFYKTDRHRTVSHVGIYLGNQEFIHAPRKGAKIRIEQIDMSYWNQRFSGARRITPPDALSTELSTDFSALRTAALPSVK